MEYMTIFRSAAQALFCGLLASGLLFLLLLFEAFFLYGIYHNYYMLLIEWNESLDVFDQRGFLFKRGFGIVECWISLLLYSYLFKASNTALIRLGLLEEGQIESHYEWLLLSGSVGKAALLLVTGVRANLRRTPFWPGG